MKAVLLLIASSFALSAAESTDPENTPERLAKGTCRVNKTEMVLFTLKDKPEERLALLFTNFTREHAAYKWMYFNPLTSDWVTGAGRLQEVYDKVPVGQGLEVVAVPGHNTQVRAGKISVEWSRGNATGSWLYFRPDNLKIEFRPAEEFKRIE